jgi:F-type H+-transporting ATPase subunit a
MATGPHVSIAAETITRFAGIPVTNSLLTTYVVMGILVVASLFVTRRMQLKPSYAQQIGEVIVEGLYNFFSSIIGPIHIKKVFPLLGSIFLFITIANWIGFFPGVGTVGLKENEREATEVEHVVTQETKPANTALVEEHGTSEAPAIALQTTEVVENGDKTHVGSKNTVESSTGSDAQQSGAPSHSKLIPLLRGPTADLNVTLSIAIVTMVFVQYFGLSTLGVSYLSKFFNFSSPIFFFVGILELVSDISKVISFSFRLFGNIFAGEVLLAVMSFLVPFLVPAPFYGLEVFVGVVQALVFSMLACVFLNVAVAHGDHGDGAHEHTH